MHIPEVARLSPVDVCVITYRNTAERIRPALRANDVLLVRNNTRDNIGFGRAANELAARGSQPIILFVNPDGDPAPHCFQRLEEALADESIVAAAAVTPGDQGGDAEWLTGACLAVRRSVFEEVGGFDDRLFLYGEDVDLSWRMAPHGRLVSIGDAVFAHDLSYRPWRSLFLQERSALTITAWHHRGPWRPRTVMKAALGNLRRGEWGLASARLAALGTHLIRPVR